MKQFAVWTLLFLPAQIHASEIQTLTHYSIHSRTQEEPVQTHESFFYRLYSALKNKIWHTTPEKNPSLSENELLLFSLAKQYPTITNKGIIKELINSGANINAQDNLGHTPLHKAVLYSTGPLYDYLISLGADEDILSYERTYTYSQVKYTKTITPKTPKELLKWLPDATPEGKIRR